MDKYAKFYKLSDITIQVKSDYPITEKTFHPKFKQFEANETQNVDLSIYHHFSIPEKITKTLTKKSVRKIFSNSFLSVFKSDDHWIYKHKQNSEFNIKYNAIVLFNNDHTIGDLYTNDLEAFTYANASLGSLVLFGGDHYLLANILSARKGLLLHANGLIYNGKGIVLLGKSGAGKSTLSRILQTNGFKLVADDRIVLQRRESEHFLIGSWCHGSTIAVTNHEIVIDKIFILEKSLNNQIVREKSSRKILKHFMQSIVRPFGEQQTWIHILDQIEDVVKKPFFYKLSFDLSRDISAILKEQL